MSTGEFDRAVGVSDKAGRFKLNGAGISSSKRRLRQSSHNQQSISMRAPATVFIDNYGI
jgi:hypothetical protein